MICLLSYLDQLSCLNNGVYLDKYATLKRIQNRDSILLDLYAAREQTFHHTIETAIDAWSKTNINLNDMVLWKKLKAAIECRSEFNVPTLLQLNNVTKERDVTRCNEMLRNAHSCLLHVVNAMVFESWTFSFPWSCNTTEFIYGTT